MFFSRTDGELGATQASPYSKGVADRIMDRRVTLERLKQPRTPTSWIGRPNASHCVRAPKIFDAIRNISIARWRGVSAESSWASGRDT